MKYFTFYKRFLTFNKYPLFRTANFKHMLINILLISLLIALPNIVSLFQSVSATTSLANIESEMPEFTIVDGQYVGESKTVQIHGNSILFSENRSTADITGADQDILVGFLKDGIYIRDVQGGGFDYSYISQVRTGEDLETFIKQQTSSLYFYVTVYIVFYTAVIMFFAVILLSIGAYVMNLISTGLKKKSRFMNWFKFSTFATVLALIPIIGIQLAAGSALWWLYLATLPFYFHYYRKLPAMK
ncbi:DUF1189 domain-containing protein [Salinicoccus hispanicus]|uniref:DUF1189 domain-containing protein n=2 Tax=Salinicoccus hispanicus TaxID=157225 RepID=A0A6N8TXK7_9STAP|nr:DUF1189 domain-containing protein [Salinicoccus hispanicus]